MKKFKLAPHVAWRRTGEEIVILDLNSSVYFSANEVGARIFELLVKPLTLEKAAAQLAAEYEVSAPAAQKDIDEFSKRLCREKLIVPA